MLIKQSLMPSLFISVLFVSPFSVCIADEAKTSTVTPEQVVQAIEKTFGVTQGERRNHTKGVCAVGEFVGIPAVAEPYSRSALFSGEKIPVVARFSLAGGNPHAPDTAKSPRGMALEFKLPAGGLQHMTMLNTPIFGAAQPQTFFDAIQAAQPDPTTGKPDPEKIKAFKASHPDSAAQGAFLASHNPPSSYANSSFWGIHTFKFINKADKTTLVRWQFVPKAGEKPLSDDMLKSAPTDFLEQTLIEQVKQAPAHWNMIVTIGVAGDVEDNPSIAWPDEREKINVGTLTITNAMPQKGADCEKVNYDPLVMSDGIAASNDPILRFRSPAYAISFAKRLSNQ
ncbi:catalase family peroxidase [Beggiatoa leptomitoformis]|uniref:Catalase-related peroxidase n=1 Tax=Beggiatoa leptomitoformis TaxID=288004 RepID=A0A2N9YAC2_9GAMM|nr:catalase family peroxidase [Beggiatoa leptomitoformis]ALG67186.1 catalase [Beggiatoa leptomitoformis]AUI67409.1 catalase [Beggiatoa leptomitoformis]